jgi:CHASE1-domain containing sensor protein/nitrogen-specific signal transduction histidine kinase
MGEDTQSVRKRTDEKASSADVPANLPHFYRSLPISRRWFPAAVLLTGLVLTLLATYYAARTIQLREHAQFETAALRAKTTIRSRLEIYNALLRGMAGFVAVEKQVTKERFRSYVNRLLIEQNYPGMQGIGLVLRVPAPDKENFIAGMEQQGEEHFHIWPAGERADFYPVAYIEPANRRNDAAVGYDMFSEPARREAMERARDTGDTAASGKLTLVQEIEGPKQPGFLIFFPLYQGGIVPEDEAGRRKKLEGFAFSDFRAGDLFANIFSGETPGVEMEIFDGTNVDSANLLFRSANPISSTLPFRRGLQETVALDVSSRTWTAHFFQQPEWNGSWIVLSLFVGGTLLSLTMYYLTRAEAEARRRAERAAAQLTASELALRESEDRLRRYTTELEQRVAERTANLAQSIQSLEGVLYHVAHDLRAPLRGMASFTNILLEDYASQLDDRGKDYARRIANAAQRMDRLVQDLLAYGRLTHTAVPVSNISLENEVNAALDQFSGEIETSGAQVEVCRPLPAVRANTAVLNQILSNLLSNALKFVASKTKPSLRISAEETTTRIESPVSGANGTPSLDVKLSALDGKFVRLWIQDNGIGIQPEYHERIFRMFERLHGAESYPGTGIGLAIVRKGVERMGGRVGVESAPGAGSRFWVELPAA